MEFSPIVACICEGSAEHAIIDILYDNNMLIFEELLDDKPILIRNAKDFEKAYLNKYFDNKIDIVRILDSRREKFNLSRRYRDKINVYNVITATEIEILIILSEDKHTNFLNEKRKDKQLKPSDYCKRFLKYKDVKTYNFVKDYFEDTDKLLNAIKKYKSVSNIPNGEKTLYDIIKPKFKK